MAGDTARGFIRWGKRYVAVGGVGLHNGNDLFGRAEQVGDTDPVIRLGNGDGLAARRAAGVIICDYRQ